MRRITLGLLLAASLAGSSAAQVGIEWGGPNNQSSLALIAPTAPTTDSSNRIATTAFVNGFATGSIPLASGKILVGSAGNLATAQTMSGDCTLSLSGVITCTQAAGNFNVVGTLSVGGGVLHTNIAAPSTPAAGKTQVYVDSTTKILTAKNDAGTLSNTVTPVSCSAAQWISAIGANAVATCSAIPTNSVTRAMEAQGVARSVVGVTGNGTANVADIQGTANQVLVVNGAGTALAFGQVNLASASAITGVLLAANGGFDPAAWTAISSPNPTCTGGTVTANSARSKTVGKTTFYQYDLTVASGTCTSLTTNINMTLPNTANSGGGTAAFENAGGATIICTILTGSTAIVCRSSINLPATSHFNISGVYENQ